jgi:hypothetical protein
MRLLILAAAAFCCAGAASAQARPPLPIASDTTGALTAIRVIDLRQLCRCPTVLLDSTVRQGTRLSMYDILDQPAAFALTADDLARIRPARHRIVGTMLRTMTRTARDTAFLAVQRLPPGRSARRYLVVVTPPNGVTAAYTVALVRHRGSWRVEGLQSVYEP